MKNAFKKIAAVFIGLTMIAGVGVAVGVNEHNLKSLQASVGNSVKIGSGTYQSVYETGFENATAGTTYNQTQTYNSTAGDGASWSVYYGTVSTNAKITGSKSMQMRWYSNAKTNYPYAQTTSAIANVKAFSFKYAVGNTNVNFKVQYGTDGQSWTDIETIKPANTSATSYTHEFSTTLSKFYFKVLVCNGTAPSSSNYTFRIDDIVFGKEIKTLDSIDANLSDEIKTWYVGDTVTASDLTVTPHYTDGTDGDPITDGNGVTVTNGTLNSVGANTINVSYGGKTATLSVTAQAARTMTGIDLHDSINKTEYYVGETWDLAGLDLEVKWSSGDPTYVSLDDEGVVYECSPATATSTSITSFDIEVLYEDFDETFTVSGLTVVEHAFEDVLTGSVVNSQNVTYTSGWATISNIQDYTGAQYSMRTMKPSSDDYTMQTNANGYFVTTKCPDNAKVKSISISFLTNNKKINIYGSNTAYDSSEAPSSSTYITELTGNGSSVSYDFNDDYKYIAFKGTASSTVIGTITIKYESLAPALAIADANVEVAVGGTASTTLTPANFSGTVAYSNDTNGCATLSYSGNIVTVKGVAVGNYSFTITAKYGSESASTTLTVNVVTARTYDSLEITTSTSDTSFEEGAVFTATGLKATATFTISGAKETVELGVDELDFSIGGNTVTPGSTTLTSTGNLTVTVSYTYSGTTHSDTYIITVNAYVANTYTKVTSAPKDWRGTYLVVYEADANAYIFNSSLSTTDAVKNYVAGTISSGVITGSKEIDAVAIQIERNDVTIDSVTQSSYYIKEANGKYLTGTASKMNNQASAGTSNIVTFNGTTPVISDNTIRFNAASDQMRFRVYASTSTMPQAVLYKMDVTSTIVGEANKFGSDFMSNIGGACDANGISDNVTSTLWNAQKKSFNALSVDAQGLIACSNGNTSGADYEKAIKLYDYIVDKYGVSAHSDFINRVDAGSLVLTSSRAIVFGTDSTGQSTALIIIVLSSVSVMGFLFVRKRKHQ